MKTVLDILEKAGGWNHGLHIHIDNAPYMALVWRQWTSPARVTPRAFSRALRKAERRRHARPRDADTIHESTTNPRQAFEPPKLEELAESIRQHGLIRPITVRIKAHTSTVIVRGQ